ncbi:MAG: hypothetical protein JGK03_27020 [Microcoleus sp. PH2017_25_DOB_D_A]|uniref:hypothetical protein n=2 Tax=unclassified Microcoleus TaxID=2642155 RepID=UPI001D6974F5|nr:MULTISPECIES: hypothetical protein [unclassified Microcoleus]MCC3414849.1 hypothetical protein [Microcoleus sp. PH2017_02_FOX_O_A]MCC3537753.1 hypothetical protein [Microcoleus sp. PH2017_25_DOB_D_A]MCC3581369.1 hypothetical protein [Microcoleus sp. PH2017_32_RDM_D_A]MCC3518990.1 hypothetical protein [Microcoleus sp. PH2017_18_LLB_O_A]MCC3619382.1 hypothetical protein [Microcoleus sp. PH2017_38_RDM_U_B]
MRNLEMFEGRRKKEEGRRKKEEVRRKKEEGGRERGEEKSGFGIIDGRGRSTIAKLARGRSAKLSLMII